MVITTAPVPTMHKRSIKISYAVLIALWGSVALLVSFRDSSIFMQGWQKALAEVVGYVAMHGQFASLLLFLALIPLCYLGLVKFSALDTGNQLWSLALGAILALTTTFTPYGTGETTPQDISSYQYAPPVVPDNMRTHLYDAYMLFRWCGYTMLFTLAAAMLFSVILHRISPNQQISGEHDLHFIADAFRSRIRNSYEQFWQRLSFARSLFTTFNTKHCATAGLMILVMWIPWIIMLSPSNIGADTIAQLLWYRTGKAFDPSLRISLPGYAMSDHHPWLDTLFYGWFDSFGLSLHNEAFGLWLLAFVHSVVISLALGVGLCYIGGKLHLSWRFCTIMLFFYGLVPMYGRLTMTVVKDLTSLPFFIFWFIMFIEYIRRIRLHKSIGPAFWFGFLALAVMCLETRKIAVYVILLSLMVVLITQTRRMLTSGLIVALIAAMIVIPMIAFPLLRVAKGGDQEMFALPMQQIFAVYDSHKDSMSAGDRKIIEESFACPISQIQKEYEEYQANPVKDCFNRELDREHIAQLLVVWVKEGILHPNTYVRSVDWLRDYFVFDGIYDQGFFVKWGWEDRGGEEILPQYQSWELSGPQKIGQTVYQSLSQLPLIGLLMSEALYVSWIPLITIALCFVLRRKSNLILMVPMLVSIGALLTTPIHNTRYSWSLCFNIALMLVIPFIELNVQKTDAHGDGDKRPHHVPRRGWLQRHGNRIQQQQHE